LQFNLCQSVQRHTETRVVTQSAELTTTALAEAAQALLVRIEQLQGSCPLQAELV
jgi:hypothetical protein